MVSPGFENCSKISLSLSTHKTLRRNFCIINSLLTFPHDLNFTRENFVNVFQKVFLFSASWWKWKSKFPSRNVHCWMFRRVCATINAFGSNALRSITSAVFVAMWHETLVDRKLFSLLFQCFSLHHPEVYKRLSFRAATKCMKGKTFSCWRTK